MAYSTNIKSRRPRNVIDLTESQSDDEVSIVPDLRLSQWGARTHRPDPQPTVRQQRPWTEHEQQALPGHQQTASRDQTVNTGGLPVKNVSSNKVSDPGQVSLQPAAFTKSPLLPHPFPLRPESSSSNGTERSTQSTSRLFPILASTTTPQKNQSQESRAEGANIINRTSSTNKRQSSSANDLQRAPTRSSIPKVAQTPPKATPVPQYVGLSASLRSHENDSWRAYKGPPQSEVRYGVNHASFNSSVADGVQFVPAAAAAAAARPTIQPTAGRATLSAAPGTDSPIYPMVTLPLTNDANDIHSAPPPKRFANGDVKSVSSENTLQQISQSSPFLPSNWDPSLPPSIIDFLMALRRSPLVGGRPGRMQVRELLLESGSIYFGSHGDLKTTAPIWDFTLEQLGMTKEGWQHLIRKGKEPVYPGPGVRAHLGRPGTKSDGISTAQEGVATPQRHASIGSMPDGPSNLQTPPDSSFIESSDDNIDDVSELSKRFSNSTQKSVKLTSQRLRKEHLVRKIKAAFPGGSKVASRWIAEEDELLIYVKEDLHLSWPQMVPHFSHRTDNWHTLQSRYSQKLKNRDKSTGLSIVPAPRLETISDACSSSRENSVQSEEDLGAINPRKSLRLEQNPDPGLKYRPREFFKRLFRQNELDKEDSEDSVLDTDHSRRNLEPGQAVRPMFRRGVDGAPLPNATAAASGSTIIPRTDNIRKPTTELLFQSDRDRLAVAGGLLKIPRGLPAATQRRHRLSRMSKLEKRRSIDVYRPYLGSSTLHYLKNSVEIDVWNEDQVLEWDGTSIHVDFSDDELARLETCVFKIWAEDLSDPIHGHGRLPLHQRIGAFLCRKSSGESNGETVSLQTLVAKISRQAISTSGILNRTQDSIENFLKDAALALQTVTKAKSKPTSKRIEVRRKELSLHHSLRHRELGSGKASDVHTAIGDSVGPLLRFTGTSSDVNVVAWAPNGSTFAVGSSALTDPASMQYNRPYNLLLGDVSSRGLEELPYHATKRIRMESGENEKEEMFNSQDPLLFQSVSAVGFTSDGTVLITTGYDNFVRVFNISAGFPNWDIECSFADTTKIDLLAINEYGLFATGSQRSDKSIRVFRTVLEAENAKEMKVCALSSSRAESNTEKGVYPSSLKWGPSGRSNHLLGGFASDTRESGGDGETCIWDVACQKRIAVARGSKAVFDVTWRSVYGHFAVASAPNTHVNRGTQSVVDLYDQRILGSGPRNPTRSCQLECPAFDVNDLIMNPQDNFLVSVGCTNSSVYVWDVRHPNQILHQFTHGEAALELEESRPHEEVDTGVRFLTWDATRRGLVSGSSDGVVAKWDPYRAPEDAYIKNLAQLKSGVMHGAFNNDFSNLLLGEVNGSVSVLALGRNNDDDDFESFNFERASDEVFESIYKPLDIQPQESAPGKRMLLDGKIEFAPFGDFPIRQAVQGPRYSGPYDRAPDADLRREEAACMQRDFRPSKSACKLDPDGPWLTVEERGDSMASQKRIPETYQFLTGEAKKKAYEGLACSRCGGETSTEESSVIRDLLISCQSCNLAWRPDLLGYWPVEKTRNGIAPKPALPTQVTKTHADGHHSRDKEYFQVLEDERNELHAMEDYAHSFWQDRLPSA